MPPKNPADLLACLLKIFFTAEWALLGLPVMAALELFANLVIILAAIAEVLIGNTSWDGAWEFAREKYGYEPGNVIKKWAEEFASKAKSLC